MFASTHATLHNLYNDCNVESEINQTCPVSSAHEKTKKQARTTTKHHTKNIALNGVCDYNDE